MTSYNNIEPSNKVITIKPTKIIKKSLQFW